jgi:hypothetical protein
MNIFCYRRTVGNRALSSMLGLAPGLAGPPQKFMTNPHWETAITYADAPHEYALRDQCPATFKFYKDRIREAGAALGKFAGDRYVGGCGVGAGDYRHKR